MDWPKISVVMPVLNRVDTLEVALESVVQQHYPNLELIILDGGSTDGTLAIIERYAEHITYWHSEQDGNPTVAANFGIRQATGEVINFLMADDVYESGVLQAIGHALQQFPDNDMYTCGGRLVQQQGDRYVTQLSFNTRESLRLTIGNVCFASSAICCRFIRKSLFETIGLYLESDGRGRNMLSNDKDFLLRAIFHHAKDHFVDQLGYTYMAHPESSTFSNNRTNVMRLCQEHMDTARKFLRIYPLSIYQRCQFWYWYNDQSSRLFVYQLLANDYKSAVANMVTSLKRYHILLPLSFIVTSLRIAFKKLAISRYKTPYF